MLRDATSTLQARTRVGKALARVAFRDMRKEPAAVATFLPGRMAYAFTLDEEFGQVRVGSRATVRCPRLRQCRAEFAVCQCAWKRQCESDVM